MKIHFGALAVLPIALFLGGCPKDIKGSVTRGECRVFDRPPYAVKGATEYDQSVADNFVESGVGGCGWQRPAPRPPELDAKPMQRPVVPRHAKKRGLLRRVKDRIVGHKKTQAPAVDKPAPIVTAPPVIEAAPPPPPLPRDPVDELLHPSAKM